MKTIIFGLLFLIFFSFSNVYAENVFLKDQGLNLSPEECQKRIDLFGTHQQPILDLAKFKAENHPAFLQLTKDQSYKLISTGGSSSQFSENCNADLPSFSIHYAIGETTGPYTRIYMNLDEVSYDVHEIRTMEIDSSWIERPKSEKLPFYVIDWDELLMEGKYRNHDPPKPSQTFKIPFIANNGKVNSIDSHQGTITADVSFKYKGIFAVKIPRNYPYTDHNDFMHPTLHEFSPFVFDNNPTDEIFAHVTKTDCYYDVWMSVSGNRTIEIGTTISYLQVGASNHGDSDVAEFCKIKTIEDKDTAYLTELSPYKQVDDGVSSYLIYCKEGLYFLVKYDGSPVCVTYNTQSELLSRDWSDTSTDIYTKYATPQILDEFNSKLLSEKQVLRVVQEFINETNLVLDVSLTNPDFEITTNLSYVPSKIHPLVRVDTLTGLPTEIVSPELTEFYRTPNWYAELQKDYLGMPSQRIENGNVVWEIRYNHCVMCHDYATIFVDAITGKIINTHNIEKLFIISHEVFNEK